MNFLEGEGGKFHRDHLSPNEGKKENGERLRRRGLTR